MLGIQAKLTLPLGKIMEGENLKMSSFRERLRVFNWKEVVNITFTRVNLLGNGAIQKVEVIRIPTDYSHFLRIVKLSIATRSEVLLNGHVKV